RSDDTPVSSVRILFAADSINCPLATALSMCEISFSMSRGIAANCSGMNLLCKRSPLAAGADRAAFPNLSYELMPTDDLWPLFSASGRDRLERLVAVWHKDGQWRGRVVNREVLSEANSFFLKRHARADFLQFR